MISIIIFMIFSVSLHKLLSITLLIPLILFYSFTESYDFQHYSSEQLPLLIITLSIYICFKMSQQTIINTKTVNLIIVIGFLLGLLPYTKLQAAPIGFVIGFWFLINVYIKSIPKDKLRNILLLALSTSLGSFIFLLPLLLNGDFHHFYNSYILWSLNYVSSPLRFIQLLNLMDADYYYWHSFMTYLFIIFLLPLLYIIFGKGEKGNINFLLLTTTVVLVAYYITVKPGRAFPHYLHFLLPLFLIMTGVLIQHLLYTSNYSKKLYIIITLIIIYSSIQTYFHFKENRRLVFDKVLQSNNIFNHSDLYQYLLPNKDKILFIWGWMAEAYIYKNVVPATRETQTQDQIEQSPLRSYFRNRLIDDFKESSPNIIIDAVSPDSFAYHDLNKFGLTSFPELMELVNANYSLITPKYKMEKSPRIYLKNSDFKVFSNSIIPIEKITASSFYDDNSHYNNLNDYMVLESSIDYWLLPDSMTGYVEFYFGKPEIIKTIKILNTKNSRWGGRSTKNAMLSLYKDGVCLKTIELKILPYPEWTIININANKFTTSVKIDVLSYNGMGGGLNEVKFFK